MKIHAAAALLAFLLALPFFAQDPPPEEVLTNEDVVTMHRFEIGEKVIVAKIYEVPEARFDLEVRDIIRLKEQGLPEAVLEAMLERSRLDQAPAPPPRNPRAAPEPPTKDVALVTAEGKTELHSVPGSPSTTYAYFTVLLFMDYPDLASETRTADPSPSLIVRSDEHPKGRMFLVKTDPDKSDKVRSVKMGKMGAFTTKSYNIPDADWVIPTEAEETQPGYWKLTPRKPLKPGEYGLWFPPDGHLYDFAIDP